MESPAIILNSAPSGAVAVKRLAVVPSTKKLYSADGAVWAEIVANAYALQGRAVVATAPTNGQVLTWVNANNDWEPATPTGGGGGGTAGLIQEVVTSGSQASVTFSAIPNTYRDLIVVVRGRGDTAATSVQIRVQANADTGSNYDYITENRFGQDSGTAVVSMRLGDLPAASAPASYPGGHRITVYDYRGTTFYKQFDSFDGVLLAQNGANMFADHNAGWWRSTAAITSLKVFLGAGNFVDGSVVTLYGSANTGGGGGSGPPYPVLTAPPTSGSFTNVQGTATVATDTLSQLVITCPASSVTWYPFTLTAPTAPWSFIAGFRMTGDFAGGFLGGLCISDGTKYVYFFSGQDIGIQYNSAVQTFGSTLLSGRSNDGQRGGVFFMKIRDDGTTNRTYSISTDGQNWIQVYSEGRTTNFTATKLGYVVLGSSSAYSGQEMVFHHSVA